MNDEIKTGDYGNFDSAVSTVTNLNTRISEVSTAIDSYQSSLSEDIFMGPIADSCKEGFTTLRNKFLNVTENFKTIGSYIEQCKSNYQNADSDAKALFLAIKEDGKLAITEGLSGGVYVNPNAEQYQVDFINRILPAAMKIYNEYGILPSLTIAQACKESSFGRYTVGNNYFGIKATKGWTGKTANARTGEQTPAGKTYHINADFRAYDSLEESVEDYGKVLPQDFYSAARNAKDYKEAAHEVRKAGYATGVSYDNSLINDYMEPYNLYQWDPVR